MLGQTVARILLVMTLIVFAHTIKPFSVKNITSHLLYTSRSLAVILPDSVRSRFDQANQLALSLSNSLFSDESTNFRLTKQNDADAYWMTMNRSNKSGPPFQRSRATTKRPSTAVNPVDPARTVELTVPREFPAAMPLALPVFRMQMECAQLKVIQPLRVDMFHLMTPKMKIIFESKKSGCDKLKGKQTKLIAFLEQAGVRYDWVKVERSIFKMQECDEAEEEGTSEKDDYPTESQEQVSLAIPEQQSHTDKCDFP